MGGELKKNAVDAEKAKTMNAKTLSSMVSGNDLDKQPGTVKESPLRSFLLDRKSVTDAKQEMHDMPEVKSEREEFELLLEKFQGIPKLKSQRNMPSFIKTKEKLADALREFDEIMAEPEQTDNSVNFEDENEDFGESSSAELNRVHVGTNETIVSGEEIHRKVSRTDQDTSDDASESYDEQVKTPDDVSDMLEDEALVEEQFLDSEVSAEEAEVPEEASEAVTEIPVDTDEDKIKNIHADDTNKQEKITLGGDRGEFAPNDNEDATILTQKMEDLEIEKKMDDHNNPAKRNKDFGEKYLDTTNDYDHANHLMNDTFDDQCKVTEIEGERQQEEHTKLMNIAEPEETSLDLNQDLKAGGTDNKQGVSHKKSDGKDSIWDPGNEDKLFEKYGLGKKNSRKETQEPKTQVEDPVETEPEEIVQFHPLKWKFKFGVVLHYPWEATITNMCFKDEEKKAVAAERRRARRRARLQSGPLRIVFDPFGRPFIVRPAVERPELESRDDHQKFRSEWNGFGAPFDFQEFAADKPERDEGGYLP